MSTAGNRIELFRGDTYDAEITVYDEDDNAENITGSSIIFTLRESVEEGVTLQKKNTAAGGGSDEIEDYDLNNGKFRLHILPADTVSLEPGEYVYDIEVTTSTGRVYTIVIDRFFVKSDVTR
jgi:hypothetical protein